MFFFSSQIQKRPTPAFTVPASASGSARTKPKLKRIKKSRTESKVFKIRWRLKFNRKSTFSFKTNGSSWINQKVNSFDKLIQIWRTCEKIEYIDSRVVEFKDIETKPFLFFKRLKSFYYNYQLKVESWKCVFSISI